MALSAWEMGTVTELLNATSISKLIKANPEDLTQAVAYYADTIKHIHSIEVPKGELPDFKVWVLAWADFLNDHLPADKAKKLMVDNPEVGNLVTDLELDS